MADVFLSYASADRPRAQQIAHALEASGWSVWWDRKIVAGDEFDRVIEREIDAAKCVVVLWSETSVASEWVKNEAAAAVERGAMVPGLISAVRVPLEFRRKQAADITDWRGDAEHAGWQMLVASVGAKVGAATSPIASPKLAANVPSSSRNNRTWVVGAGLGGTLVLVLAVLAFRNQSGSTENTVLQAETKAATEAQPESNYTNTRAVGEKFLENAAAMSTNYALSCRGGGTFEVVHTSEGRLRIGFAAAADHLAANLDPGECGWNDRPLSDAEPRVLCDDTSGAMDLVRALARKDEYVQRWVHYDPTSACLRVVLPGKPDGEIARNLRG